MQRDLNQYPSIFGCTNSEKLNKCLIGKNYSNQKFCFQTLGLPLSAGCGIIVHTEVILLSYGTILKFFLTNTCQFFERFAAS